MIINKKKIHNPARYLLALREGEGFYAAARVTSEKLNRLRKYGLQQEMKAWIPVPLGAATRLNADGKWIARKDLPKETRLFECEFRIIDWHGTEHTGTCWHQRLCYQRELIKPAELAFTYDGEMIYSPLLHNVAGQMENAKLAINVLLEMLGSCTIMTADKCPAELPIAVRTVPWEILRRGSRDEEDWRKHLERVVERRPIAHRNIIRRRHETLRQLKPDYCILGKQHFWGYVVYAFEKKGLYIFECDRIDNATYVFVGDWESTSQCTKTEILAGGLQEARIFHTDHWQENLVQTVTAGRKL